jgi:uncharacterized protein
MSIPDGAPAPAVTGVLSPVLTPERLVTLDVLRGLALLGVVVVNVWLCFTGLMFRFPAYRDELRQLSLDTVVFFALAVLVSGKAMTTFSFLFGHGFAIQMLRAEARGRSIVPVYARRLAVLLAIGLTHMILLWYGDILTIYAAFGFMLLLFRKRADRTLLVWAAIFSCGAPLLMAATPWMLSAFGVSLPPPDLNEIAQRNAAALAVFQGASYPDIIRENVHQAGQFYVGRKSIHLLYIAGLFLAGLYVGRRRIFEHVDAHRRAFVRIAVFGIPIGVAAGLAMAYVQLSFEPADIMARPQLMLLLMALFVTSTVPLAAGYVSAATLLLRHPAFSRYLLAFAPVGRMALTNYLSQTIVMLVIFYGYGGGLIGRTGPAAGLAIAVGFFAVQMAWSHAWLARFQFGPMEWVWRSLTYGTPQPMRAPRDREAALAIQG